MNSVKIEQKSYEMPPREGFSVAHFLTVGDIDRSARFYEKVFDGRILSRGDSEGAPAYVQIANTWLLVNVGGVFVASTPATSGRHRRLCGSRRRGRFEYPPGRAGLEKQIHRPRDPGHSVPRWDRSRHGASASWPATTDWRG